MNKPERLHPLPAFMERAVRDSFLLLLLSCVPSRGVETNTQAILRDIVFAQIGTQALRLDVHLPLRKPRSPLIVWVHGGAWRSGSREEMPLGKLVEAGYAVVCADYRLSPQAKFPAQVHDLKAAVRFLRGQDGPWSEAARKVVMAGDSAGAHLAALVGVSNGHAELEGEIGNHGSQSSVVQGIVSVCGGANLTTILQQSTPHGLSVRVPALELLLGGQPDSVPALARLASPVFHVDASDPPLLLMHGDQDPQMPVNQSLELHGVYQKAEAPVQLEIVHGAGHGGSVFYDGERMELVKRFLRRHF
jgi:acetyl esterase/lipase